MKQIFTHVCIPIIALGIIAMSLNMIMGNVISFATPQRIGQTDLIWYRYDITGYLNNLTNSFRNTTELKLSLPSREWYSEATQGTWFARLLNNLAVITDYLILILNILLYPLRIGFYFVQIILNLIGINTIDGQYEDNPLKWLIDLTKTFKTLEIPYI